MFADADMDKAIATITTAGFFNAGQDCTAATRIPVEQSIYAEFLEKLIQKTKSIKFGPPEDQNALYGALNSRNQLEQVKGFIERLPAHAKIETGGRAGPVRASILSRRLSPDCIKMMKLFSMKYLVR